MYNDFPVWKSKSNNPRGCDIVSVSEREADLRFWVFDHWWSHASLSKRRYEIETLWVAVYKGQALSINLKYKNLIFIVVRLILFR